MGHWYNKDGKPCHFQEDGKDTTLRHARKQDLRPSVTEILNIMDKPGLTRYFINQHLEAAWDNPLKTADQSYAEWCKEIRQMASQHGQEAAEHGTKVHDALERWLLGKEIQDQYLNTVGAVYGALKGVYGEVVDTLKPEVTFATETYGGSVDAVGEGLILDFKTKQKWETKKDSTPKKMWYVESHAAQLAAYRHGLGVEARCSNVFIGPEDEVFIHEWSEEDLERGLRIFTDCLSLWKDTKDF